LLILLFMGLITFLEIFDFQFFEKFFTLIKTPSSWFVGLSLAYCLSHLIQKSLFFVVSKRFKTKEDKKEDFFIGFVIVLIIASLIMVPIKNLIVLFFNGFFIYFHIILMQSVIILYLLFKIDKDFEISTKYVLTNEVILLIYTLIVLYFVA